MPRQPEFPVVIKAGPASVRIYRVKHKSNKSGFAYVLVWKSGRARKLQQFASLGAATEEARIKVAQLADGRVAGAEMSKRDRDELVEARRLCGDIPLLAALEEWKRSRDLAGGQLIPAAEAWATRNGKGFQVICVAEVVDQFLAAKKRLGVDVSASYMKILPTLTAVLGERSLDSLSSRELSAWLDQRHPRPVTRNTARKRIVTLWRWARKQGFLPRDALTEAEQTDTAREPPKKIGVISSETYRRLLEYVRANQGEYLAPLVFAGLCGLRRSEIHGQSWKDVEIDRALLHVTTAKRNTPAYRLVPLSPNAIAWLNLCAGREGEVCEDLAVDHIRKVGREAGFVLPKNCFRHSFISHRVAKTGNVAETSLEAGNSPEEIFRDYRELFSKSEGEAWFNIFPSSAAAEIRIN